MGLDQFLYKRNKLRENDDEYNKLAKRNAEEVTYWRKANQINGWFEKNVGHGNIENLEEYIVTKDDLIKLVKDCETVLEDHSLAEKIMPVTTGFFFGSQEYDKWYFIELESTVTEMKVIIEETDFDKEELVYKIWY